MSIDKQQSGQSLSDIVFGNPATLCPLGPLDALAAKMLIGTHVFTVSRFSGLTPWQIECMLFRYGICSYGSRFGHWLPEGQRSQIVFIFDVATKQARWADYLLRRAGIAIISGGLAERNSAPMQMPRAWQPGRRPQVWALFTPMLMPVWQWIRRVARR